MRISIFIILVLGCVMSGFSQVDTLLYKCLEIENLSNCKHSAHRRVSRGNTLIDCVSQFDSLHCEIITYVQQEYVLLNNLIKKPTDTIISVRSRASDSLSNASILLVDEITLLEKISEGEKDSWRVADLPSIEIECSIGSNHKKLSYHAAQYNLKDSLLLEKVTSLALLFMTNTEIQKLKSNLDDMLPGGIYRYEQFSSYVYPAFATPIEFIGTPATQEK